jgi:hypothetical protein
MYYKKILLSLYFSFHGYVLYLFITKNVIWGKTILVP